MATCVHCSRDIVQDADGRWVDPEATGDDSVWRETCDSNDTDRIAAHEPDPIDTPCAACNADAGEPCRPGCIGKAAHDEGDA